MTIETINSSKHRGFPGKIFWLSSAALVGILWCIRKLKPEKKPLTRSEEKQRRKALVRDTMQLRKVHN